MQDGEKLKFLLENSINFCEENKIEESKCTQNIIKIVKDFSFKTKYNAETILSNSNGNVIWSKPDSRYDKVTASYISIVLPDLYQSKNLEFVEKNPYNWMNFFNSVFKSMTFSITDFYSTCKEKDFITAIKYFQDTYWYRSRPAIGFFIFSFILLWLYKKRQEDQLETEKEKEMERIELFKSNELLTIEKKSLQAKYEYVCEKVAQYDNIINQPNTILTLSDLSSENLNGIGNKFRKIIEKLLLPIYYTNFPSQENIDLKNAINDLHFRKKIISAEIRSYLDIIRIYGNIDSHYNKTIITKDEAITLAGYIILFIDELLSNDLLNESKGTTSETETIIVAGGIRKKVLKVSINKSV
jgi:hypothetical protein